MKKTLLLSVVTLLTLTKPASSQAAQTNLVQSLKVNLTALFQGPNSTNQHVIFYSVTPQKISNSDIIQQLEVATSKTFTTAARLLLITPLVPDANTAVVVQDGATRVDVTGFFGFDAGDVQVAKGSTNTVTSAERGTQYQILGSRLRDNDNYPNLSMHFRVRGFGEIKYGTLSNNAGVVIGEAQEYLSTVAGTADLNGQDAVVRGTVSVTGRQTEIVN